MYDFLLIKSGSRDPEWKKIRIRDKHPGSATLHNINLYPAFPPHSLRHTWHAVWINVSRPAYTVRAHSLREPKRVETCGLPPTQRPKALECWSGVLPSLSRGEVRQAWFVLWWKLQRTSHLPAARAESAQFQLQYLYVLCTRRTLITRITYGRQEQYSRVPSLWSPICMNM